jgi:hypothetical protein
VTLDVFLESVEGFERDAAEEALARNGVSADSTVTTADGGDASVTIADDGCVFVVKSLTQELAEILYDVAQSADLAILPADGTPTAIIVDDDTEVDDELEPLYVDAPDELYDALRQSVARKEEARGARPA